MTFDQIVDCYIRDFRDEARAELRFFEIQRTASAAIEKAALCLLPSGKRHPHQRRIPKKLLELAEGRLQAVRSKLAIAQNFDGLYRTVDQGIGAIKGIGKLTVYDIAHRIGAHFGKQPDFVYLHAGTRKGAKALHITGDSFDPHSLPKPFSRLQPYEIEDCLCLYKDELSVVGQAHPANNTLGGNPKKAGCMRERVPNS
jgi:hypothetical protein